MTEPTRELAALEASHVAAVQAWSGRIAEWTLRAAAMRQEREALERELTEESARMVMQLLRHGFTIPLAEKRVEQLLERAFTKVPQ